MICHYINLDSAVDRRAALEQYLRKYAAHWTPRRFSAVTAEQATMRGARGALRPAEIACFMSHLEVVAKVAEQAAPCMIVEDDVQLGAKSAVTLEGCVRHAERSGEWDVLFSDVGLVQVGMMAEFVGMRRELLKRGQTRLLDLKNFAFYGANAYILHPSGAKRILESARNIVEWNVPYDIFLRRIIHDGRLSARVVFPFATTVSDHASRSAIQPHTTSRTDFVWNLFRRMIWQEGDANSLLPDVATLSSGLETESKAYAILWAAMVDPSFRPK